MNKTRILELMGYNKGVATFVYFDMDGVLANFDKSIMQDPQINSLKQEYLELANQHPATRGKAKDDVKEILRGEQTDPDLAAIKKAFRAYNNATYSYANRKGFFINLEPMEGAREMLIAAKKLTGQRPNILTAPMKSNPHCEAEKKQWVERHLRGLYNEFICDLDKGRHAKGYQSVLVDDRPKYVNMFRDKGGYSIMYHSPNQVIADLQTWFESISPDNLNENLSSDNLKISGIIKLKVPVTGTVKKAQVVSQNNNLVPLEDKDLHVTLLTGKSFHKLKPFLNDLDLSDIVPPTPNYDNSKLFISKRSELDKVSSFLVIENQMDFTKMVDQILRKLVALGNANGIDFGIDDLTDYDAGRFFHVSIANKDGSPFSSIGDITKEDTWYSKTLNER